MRISVLAGFFLCLASGFFAPVLAQVAAAPAARVSNTNILINDLLGIDDLLVTMGDEAVADLSRTLGKGMSASDSAALRQQLDRVYAPERLSRLLFAALATELAGQDAQIIDDALRFYDTPLGRRIVGLELSARRALLDGDQARMADDMLARAQERGDRRIAQIERLMAATNVVDSSVLSGLNGSLQVSRGFHAAMGETRDAASLATESAALEQQLRKDITHWVQRMLLLAYQPLGDHEVEALILFVSTPEARVLSDCLTRAFDAVFMRLSFEVGMISGAALGGEEI